MSALDDLAPGFYEQRSSDHAPWAEVFDRIASKTVIVKLTSGRVLQLSLEDGSSQLEVMGRTYFAEVLAIHPRSGNVAWLTTEPPT